MAASQRIRSASRHNRQRYHRTGCRSRITSTAWAPQPTAIAPYRIHIRLRSTSQYSARCIFRDHGRATECRFPSHWPSPWSRPCCQRRPASSKGSASDAGNFGFGIASGCDANALVTSLWMPPRLAEIDAGGPVRGTIMMSKPAHNVLLQRLEKSASASKHCAGAKFGQTGHLFAQTQQARSGFHEKFERVVFRAANGT